MKTILLYNDGIFKVEKRHNPLPINIEYIISRGEYSFTMGELPLLTKENIEKLMNNYLWERYMSLEIPMEKEINNYD